MNTRETKSAVDVIRFLRATGSTRALQMDIKDEQDEARKAVVEICDICMRINQKTQYRADFDIHGKTATITVTIRKKEAAFQDVAFGGCADLIKYETYDALPDSNRVKYLLKTLKFFEKEINKERNI